jgi:hypothetical protein
VAPFSLLIVFSSFIAFIRAQLIISPGVSIGDFITVRKLISFGNLLISHELFRNRDIGYRFQCC